MRQISRVRAAVRPLLSRLVPAVKALGAYFFPPSFSYPQRRGCLFPFPHIPSLFLLRRQSDVFDGVFILSPQSSPFVGSAADGHRLSSGFFFFPRLRIDHLKYCAWTLTFVEPDFRSRNRCSFPGFPLAYARPGMTTSRSVLPSCLISGGISLV